jgi:hypothetical protein
VHSFELSDSLMNNKGNSNSNKINSGNSDNSNKVRHGSKSNKKQARHRTRSNRRFNRTVGCGTNATGTGARSTEAIEECPRVTKKEVRTKVRTIEKKVRTIDKTVREIEKTVRSIEKVIRGIEKKELELRASTVHPTEIDTVKPNEFPLTFSSKTSNNKWKKRNSQGYKNFNKGIQGKSFGTKSDKTKRQRSKPRKNFLEPFGSESRPFTAAQTKRLDKLINQALKNWH